MEINRVLEGVDWEGVVVSGEEDVFLGWRE